jgi:hypothetical protein
VAVVVLLWRSFVISYPVLVFLVGVWLQQYYRLEIKAVYSPYNCCLIVVSVTISDIMSGGKTEFDSVTVLLYTECHFVSLGNNITFLSHCIIIVRHCVITVSGRLIYRKGVPIRNIVHLLHHHRIVAHLYTIVRFHIHIEHSRKPSEQQTYNLSQQNL